MFAVTGMETALSSDRFAPARAARNTTYMVRVGKHFLRGHQRVAFPPIAGADVSGEACPMEMLAERDVDPSATRPEKRRALWAANRVLRLIDARDAPRVGSLNPAAYVARADLLDLFAWHRQRYLSAQADADTEESNWLRDAERAYRNVDGEPSKIEAEISQLRVDGPAMVPLAAGAAVHLKDATDVVGTRIGRGRPSVATTANNTDRDLALRVLNASEHVA